MAKKSKIAADWFLRDDEKQIQRLDRIGFVIDEMIDSSIDFVLVDLHKGDNDTPPDVRRAAKVVLDYLRNHKPNPET